MNDAPAGAPPLAAHLMRGAVMALAAFAVVIAIAPSAIAQPGPDQARLTDDDGGITLGPAVRRAVDAAFLTDDERAAMRVRHGVWEEGDLDDPAARARAALSVGRYWDAVFDDDSVPALDRADALLGRGELEAATAMVAALLDDGTDEPYRAARIAAQALFGLAQYDQVGAVGDVTAERLAGERVERGDELAEAVRVLDLRTVVRGPELEGGGDYQELLRLIGVARDELDPLSPLVRLVEAEILYRKHNTEEAVAAAQEALARHPKLSGALTLLGNAQVDAFAFGPAGQLADMLDANARDLAAERDEWPAAHAGAAIVRVRARMRQRDGRGAEIALEPARAIMPRHPGLIALHAAAASEMFDDQKLAELLSELEAIAPGSAEGQYEVGRALAEARQYEESGRYLRRAIDLLPTRAAPHIELGLMELQAGNDAAARRALEDAARLDRFNRRANNSLELVRDLAAFSVVESEHFRIRFQEGVDRLLAEEMLPVMERIHARVAGDPEGDELGRTGGIGHEPDRKTLIELMPDHRWFAVRITGVTGIHTIAAATGPVIAMEAPREGANSQAGPYDWPRVLQHEYVHTVTLSRTRNRIPHWFTEAAAVYLEDSPRDMDTWRLLRRAFETGTLFDLEQINIAFVRPERPQDRSQAYAQGHWMYQYIVDGWGPAAPVELMDRYAAGLTEREAFEMELGVTGEVFLDGFLEWAEADLRGVGMLPPEGAPGMPELMAAAQEDAGGEFEMGEGLVRTLLDEHPGHPDLLEALATMTVNPAAVRARGTGLTDEEAALLEELAAARPVDDGPHRMLALHYLSVVESSEGAARAEAAAAAIGHLLYLDDREQRGSAFASRLAELKAELGRWDGAMERAVRATHIDPYDPTARELAARVAIAAGRPADARRHLEALIVLEPDAAVHPRRLEALDRLIAER